MGESKNCKIVRLPVTASALTVMPGETLCSRRTIRGPIMATPKHLTLARLAPALALLSCAAPKAHVVEQPLPAGRPLAGMINAGFAPAAYRRMFRSVRQTRVVGEN